MIERLLRATLDFLVGSGRGHASQPAALARPGDAYFRAFLGHCLDAVYGPGRGDPPRGAA
jgi:hypothetical protein